jgi:hypothetical protein
VTQIITHPVDVDEMGQRLEMLTRQLDEQERLKPCGGLFVRSVMPEPSIGYDMIEVRSDQPGVSLPMRNPHKSLFIPVKGSWKVIVNGCEVDHFIPVNGCQELTLEAQDPGCIGLVVFLE